LSWIFRHNDRSVLRTVVGTLPIERGGIVGIPEKGDDFFIGNPSWIEGDPDHLSVSAFSGANLLVARVRFFACGISASDGFNARLALINGLNAPKTAPTHNGVFFIHGCTQTQLHRYRQQEGEEAGDFRPADS
jgi:hypothetical protein